MSKRDDDSSADLDVGMTTAERRRRRRRGALRVPSDNVPRGRAPTSPPVVAPVPEDPALAMSIAYSFTSDASDAVPRVLEETGDDLGDLGDMAKRTLENMPAQRDLGDGDGTFTPVAPEAIPTVIDPPNAPVEQQDFEMKTREMAAVDLEALGLAELEPRTAVRPPLEPAPDELPSIIIAPEAAAAAADDRHARGATAPMVGPPDEPARRDSDIEVDVGGLEGSTLDTDLPESAPDLSSDVVADSSPSLPVAVPAGPAEMSSPGIALSDYDLETTSVGSLPTAEAAPPPAPALPTPPILPAAQSVPTGRPRLKTVALSEEDLEEVREAARAANAPAVPRARSSSVPGIAPPSAVPAAPADGTHTQPLSARDVEIVRQADGGGGGEIEVDVEVGNESDRNEVRRPSAPPPPPAAKADGHTPPPPPVGKTEGAHPPPPPPPTERHRAPPTPPPPSKKVSTPPPAAVSSSSAGGKDKAPRGKPWFVDLFDEDYLRTLPFLTAQATQSEAEFVIDAMNLSPGAQLLDVGCGYGRHAMELAARGYHLVGLDLSTPLLVRGGEEAHRRGLTINFVRGDMRELDFDAQFDGAYCLFSTFGYFDDETNKKTLANIARALRPGGRILLEILNRDYVIADLPTRVWWEGDGCVVLEEVELNYFSSRIQVNRSVVFDDGRQLEQEISIRAYALHEVGKLMHAAGFRVLEVSGGYQTRGRFFGNQSRHIIVLAERKDPSAT